MRLLLAALLIAHGLIHLLGFAKAFSLAELPQLIAPVSPAMGILWLAAAILFIVTAGALFASPHWWWATGFSAILISTVAIIPSWTDAKAGALVNAVVLLAVVVGFIAWGPISLRWAYDDDVERAVAIGGTISPVGESDIAPLPAPLQRYLRVTGTVGQPRVRNFRARMHGRFRSAADAPWMPFTAEQHNFFDGRFYDGRSRLFYMEASRSRIPMQGYHRYVGPDATMQIRMAWVVPVMHVSGAEMTRGETVTLFNDMCLLAPATLIDSTIAWSSIDDHTVDGTFTNAGQTVRARLVFNDAGELKDFWSDDRLRASEDGSRLTNLRWSTPVTGYRSFGPIRLEAGGEARWHDPGGEWPYIELVLDDVTYNIESL